MKKNGLSNLGSALLMMFANSYALADDNAVYIGQTGFTNTVDVDQVGQSNKVGFDEISLFVSQDGSYNALSVTQFGYINEVGATAFAGTLGLYGIYQTGENNRASVMQTNTDVGGSNIVGAIDQRSPEAIGTTIVNDLMIEQTADAPAGGIGTGNGTANHVIGEVRQLYTGAGDTTNSASILQFDGASGGVEGNRVQTLIQEGQSNRAFITQRDEANQIGDFRQYGTNNEANITQQDGSDNEVTSLLQDGDSNDALITMAGARNILFSAVQSNALIGVAGNIFTLTLAGDDNGGDGMGGLGQFQLAITDLLEVAQAEIKQFGDENNLNFVTSASSKANLYGFIQEGDGNALSGTVEGNENEAAALQLGDGNRLDFSQNGDGNGLAVSFKGDDNRLNADQTGDGNLISVKFDGATDPITRSNQNNDPALGGFTGIALAFAGSLNPGDILQTGNLNDVTLHVTAGNFNKFAMSQTGDNSVINGTVAGNSNQAIIIQAGSFNTAQYRQSGNNNQVIILQ